MSYVINMKLRIKSTTILYVPLEESMQGNGCESVLSISHESQKHCAQ